MGLGGGFGALGITTRIARECAYLRASALLALLLLAAVGLAIRGAFAVPVVVLGVVGSGDGGCDRNIDGLLHDGVGAGEQGVRWAGGDGVSAGSLTCTVTSSDRAGKCVAPRIPSPCTDAAAGHAGRCAIRRIPCTGTECVRAGSPLRSWKRPREYELCVGGGRERGHKLLTGSLTCSSASHDRAGTLCTAASVYHACTGTATTWPRAAAACCRPRGV